MGRYIFDNKDIGERKREITSFWKIRERIRKEKKRERERNRRVKKDRPRPRQQNTSGSADAKAKLPTLLFKLFLARLTVFLSVSRMTQRKGKAEGIQYGCTWSRCSFPSLRPLSLWWVQAYYLGIQGRCDYKVPTVCPSQVSPRYPFYRPAHIAKISNWVNCGPTNQDSNPCQQIRS